MLINSYPNFFYVDSRPWVIAQILKRTDFRFELNKAQSIDGIPSDVIRGCKFKVDPIEPIVFETDGGPEETTGTVDVIF